MLCDPLIEAAAADVLISRRFVVICEVETDKGITYRTHFNDVMATRGLLDVGLLEWETAVFLPPAQ